MTSTAQQLRLADGRELDVRIAGGSDPAAPVLVYHHGTPSSGRVPADVVAAATGRGMRVVSWSRPGYATSTRQPGRSVADVASDAREVLDALGIGQVFTMGWSGGGPHALACGALMADRVLGVASLAGVAPYAESIDSLNWMAGMGQDNIDEFGAALAGESVLAPALAGAREGLSTVTADGIVAEMESLLPDVDREYLGPGFGDDLAASFREAVATSADGWVDDDLAFTRPWGFDLATIPVPVAIWQGSEDLMVPFAHGTWLAAAMPHARAHLAQGEGHLSVVVGAIDQIFDDLLAHRGRA
jgi:pimeloyl-ACP methyl ester carboxylesterase